MGRGGYQRPTNPSSFSGVGKNSRRTDGRQAIRSPNVTESTDLQQGDRERIRQGQKIAPLSETRTPSVSAPPSGGPSPAGGGGAGLPPLDLPSTRPGEPLTEGLPFGPGAGPDVLTPPEPQDEMEVVLQAMVELTGDTSIHQMLDDHREFKAWKNTAAVPAPVQPGPIASQPDLATEGVMAGEDEGLSVETSAIPSDLEGGEDVSASLPISDDGSTRPSDGEMPLPPSDITPLPQP